MSIRIRGADVVVKIDGQAIAEHFAAREPSPPPCTPSYYDRAATSGWRTHPAFPSAEIIYDESHRLTPELWDRAMAIRRARYA